MARKCCGGLVVTSTARVADNTPALADQPTTKIQYIGQDGTTWTSPSKVVYKVSPSKPIVEILVADKAWFLSRQERGKFFFAPIDEPAKETVAQIEIAPFEVKAEEIEAEQIAAEEKAAQEIEAAAEVEPEESEDDSEDTSTDDKPKPRRRSRKKSSG